MTDQMFDDMVDSIMRADSEHLEELLHLDRMDIWERLTTFVTEGEFKGQTLLHIAADKSRNKCVRILLSQINILAKRQYLCNLQEKNEYGRIPLHTVLDGGCRCGECTAKNVDCVEVLLEEGSNVNAKDNDGDTPLIYATKFMMSDCASLLLEYGADANIQLFVKEGKKKKLILYEYIAQKIPSALTALLDKGITPSEDSAVLNLDFKIFLHPNNEFKEKEIEELENISTFTNYGRETDILVCMANSNSAGREQLLTHPMTLAFLHFKWSLVRRYVFFVQLSYFVMTVLYTLFVLEAFDHIIPEDDDDNAIPTEAATMMPNLLENISSENLEPGTEPRRNKTLIQILTYFVCVWWIFMVLNELYEISLGLRIYLRVSLNYAWWVLIICVGISVPPGFGVDAQLWQLPLAAFALFMAWGLILVQTSRFPTLGIYIEMLGKVVADFAIFLITFAALLIGFALAFHVLFPEDEMFSNVATAFVRVILIMIGETDYEGLFEQVVNPDGVDAEHFLGLEYTIPAHIIFIGFIFVITIVLMNLLLGLAVSDIQELKKVATVLRVKRQIEQIQLFESLVLGRFVPSIVSKWAIRYFSIMKILEQYHLESETSIRIQPTNPQFKTIPKDLKEMFISYVLQTPCINPENLMTTTENKTMETSDPTSNDRSPGGGRHGRKRLARLESKMDQIQTTLLEIQEQLLEFQLQANK